MTIKNLLKVGKHNPLSGNTGARAPAYDGGSPAMYVTASTIPEGGGGGVLLRDVLAVVHIGAFFLFASQALHTKKIPKTISESFPFSLILDVKTFAS